jgi:hypothetical protein
MQQGSLQSRSISRGSSPTDFYLHFVNFDTITKELFRESVEFEASAVRLIRGGLDRGRESWLLD